MITIQCKYSCVYCGLRQATVDVPARLDPDKEPVVNWMKTLGTVVGNDHQRRSPHCQTKTLQDVMIPITNAGWVGGPQLE